MFKLHELKLLSQKFNALFYHFFSCKPHVFTSASFFCLSLANVISSCASWFYVVVRDFCVKIFLYVSNLPLF